MGSLAGQTLFQENESGPRDYKMDSLALTAGSLKLWRSKATQQQGVLQYAWCGISASTQVPGLLNMCLR